MTHPIDKLEYWKERIAGAKNRRHEHYSVYEIGDQAWAGIAAIHEKIIRQFTQGKKTLDAACGYGRASEWVEDYTGVDFSPDFIVEARAKYPGKDFIVASLEDLSFFDKDEFDIVFCISVRHMIINNLGADAWAKMEKELCRVGKQVLLLEYGNALDGAGDADKYELLK